MREVTWSPLWIRHSADVGFSYTGIGKCYGNKSAQPLDAPKECTCMLTGPHTHCPGCGRLVSTGDGKIIAQFSVRLPRKAGAR